MVVWRAEMLFTMIIGLLTLSASVAPDCIVQRPISERRCVHGFITCEHGYCDRITDPCTCDSDIWSGVKCEKLYCPPECNGLCECYDNNVVCLQAETSQVSGSTVPNNQVVTTQILDPPRNDVIQQEHVCSDNYTLRPLLERYCKGVFCKYGKCAVTERGNHRCQCDLGGAGDLCEKRCCKLCGDSGCKIINGTEYCDYENPPGKDLILGEYKKHQNTELRGKFKTDSPKSNFKIKSTKTSNEWIINVIFVTWCRHFLV